MPHVIIPLILCAFYSCLLCFSGIVHEETALPEGHEETIASAEGLNSQLSVCVGYHVPGTSAEEWLAIGLHNSLLAMVCFIQSTRRKWFLVQVPNNWSKRASEVMPVQVCLKAVEIN